MGISTSVGCLRVSMRFLHAAKPGPHCVPSARHPETLVSWGHIVFHWQGTLKPLFRAFYMVCPSAWFLRHKPRNVLILRSVLDHSGTLSGAEWVGLYFRLHKAHRQNPSFFGTFFGVFVVKLFYDSFFHFCFVFAYEF